LLLGVAAEVGSAAAVGMLLEKGGGRLLGG